MNQITLVSDKTFEVVKSTVKKLADFVRPTFGPSSGKVIISKFTHTAVIDDGVQIARDFELPDPSENTVAKIIREVAVRTNDRVGDGTTGSILMLEAIINEASKSKLTPREIEIELKRGQEEVSKELRSRSQTIKTKEDLKKVSKVSFDNESIAEMISSTYFKLGKDCTITLDKSPTMDTFVHTTDGVEIPRGYISPYMIVNPEKMETVSEKPYILITDYRITETTDIMPIMNLLAAQEKRELIVICENMEGSALATAVVNKMQGKFLLVAIAAPSGDNRKIFLEDLALLTGAKMFTESKGDKLSEATISDLGRAEKIITRKEETIIVNPKGDKKAVSSAVKSLQSAISSETKESVKKELEQRLGVFTNTIAVIKVGAPTDNEQKALKYKVEDAVNSTRVAYRGGVVCGGGLALARITTSSPILNKALKYPAIQLFSNMGGDNVNEYLAEKQAWNLVTGERGDPLKVGVIDPTDALIAAVDSAVSIASVLITSTGMIVESPKENKD